MIRLALYQPDIPQNAGTLLRLGACLDIAVDIIEPAGFVFDDKKLRRAGMDYLDLAERRHHVDFTSFDTWRRSAGRRLVLLTRHAAEPYTSIRYAPGDSLLVGQESAGVPDHVHDSADLRVTIPQATDTRSLNVALAAAMVTGEALRQIAGFPAR